MSKLTFDALRMANVTRIPLFRGRLGQVAHPPEKWRDFGVPGSDWTPAQWLQAVVGELGELANVMKKNDRGDLTEAGFRMMARQEIADVLIYLDILAYQLGADLGQCALDTFNDVSERVGAEVWIEPTTGVVFLGGRFRSGVEYPAGKPLPVPVTTLPPPFEYRLVHIHDMPSEYPANE